MKLNSKAIAIKIKLIFLVLLFSPSLWAKSYSSYFKEDYDLVWKSLLIALSSYPLEVNEQETGRIKTALIEGGRIWEPYGKVLRDREQYQIFVQAHKIRHQGRNLIKVSLEKKIIYKGDFITEDKTLESDGIEEAVLLYRIKREAKIDALIEKIFK